MAAGGIQRQAKSTLFRLGVVGGLHLHGVERKKKKGYKRESMGFFEIKSMWNKPRTPTFLSFLRTSRTIRKPR